MHIAFDTETHLPQPGIPAPEVVCMSYCVDGIDTGLVHKNDPECYRLLRAWLESDHISLSGHWVVYDLSVIAAKWPEFLDLIFDKLDADLITCTSIRAKLIDIARGQYRGYKNALTEVFTEFKYNQGDLIQRFFGESREEVKSGADSWRLRYAELDDVPCSEWPQAAIDYPLQDAKDNYRLWNFQNDYAHYLDDEFRQVRADWALRLTSCYGIRTSRPMVQRWQAEVQGRLDRYRDDLMAAGLVVKNEKKGTYHKKTKLAQEYAKAVWLRKAIKDYPKTDSGLPSLDALAAKKAQDPLLTAYQEYSSAGTIMSRVDELWQGVDMPIHTRFDSLMDTGRCSSTKPNIQNRARKPGDRECFVPYEGNVFLVADLDGFELRTIAQSCLWAVGHSKLAQVLNAGQDPHLMMAATMLRISFEEAKRRYEAGDPEVEEARGAKNAKMANFGFPAGLGVNGFIQHALENGFIFTKAEAEKLYEDYLTTWPEMREYFKWIRTMLGQAGVATIKHFRSNRFRGMIPYTVACNSFSQGLGGDAAKHALYHLVRECYIGKSILNGCRPANFIHDEYMLEAKDDEFAHDKAMIMERIITERANEWLPDVPTRAKPLITRRMSKNAKAKFDSNNRLIPWEWDQAVH